jgi:hypothetical protein
MLGSPLIPALAALAFPASAPPAQLPPTRAIDGVRIVWPARQASVRLSAGALVRVRVRSDGPRSRVRLVRVTASGKPMRTIARATLRSGSFSVALPLVAPARYALRAQVAGHRYWSWIVVAASPTPPAPAPTPTPVPPSGPPTDPLRCADGGGSRGVQLVLGAASAAAGGQMPYKIVNSGTSCLTIGAAYVLQQQQPDGSWRSLPGPPFPLWAALLNPGASFAKSAAIPASAAAGSYRVLDAGQTTSVFAVTAH